MWSTIRVITDVHACALSRSLGCGNLLGNSPLVKSSTRPALPQFGFPCRDNFCFQTFLACVDIPNEYIMTVVSLLWPSISPPQRFSDSGSTWSSCRTFGATTEAGDQPLPVHCTLLWQELLCQAAPGRSTRGPGRWRKWSPQSTCQIEVGRWISVHSPKR